MKDTLESKPSPRTIRSDGNGHPPPSSSSSQQNPSGSSRIFPNPRANTEPLLTPQYSPRKAAATADR